MLSTNICVPLFGFITRAPVDSAGDIYCIDESQMALPFVALNFKISVPPISPITSRNTLMVVSPPASSEAKSSLMLSFFLRDFMDTATLDSKESPLSNMRLRLSGVKGNSSLLTILL